MAIVSQLVFLAVFGAAVYFFSRKVGKVRRNILLGKQDGARTDNPSTRLGVMLRVALGQQKMVTRIIPAVLHIFIYVGFLVVNIEVLEIVVDGALGTHRVFGQMEAIAPLYNAITWLAELFLVLVLFASLAFLTRRNILNIKRFNGVEMTQWPRLDANLILLIEIVLVFALVVMNATDGLLRSEYGHSYAGMFPFSSVVNPLFSGMSEHGLELTSTIAWWIHFVGILSFLNYIPYSKHFHIMMAFPNTYFSNLELKGKTKVDEKVKKEVELMMGDPYAAPPAADPNAVPEKFGAKDIADLSWKNLFEAYTCTECGRCTSVCPANTTGKLLSPRKIMMDTRDRMEEVGRVIDAKGKWEDDGKSLLDNYITREELWACTTCNACVQACPVNISPLDIILQMREYVVMEESKAPEQLNGMFNNVQNNGAPWAFPAADRFNWAANVTAND
jgi:heterodisulfide reductase subunit C